MIIENLIIRNFGIYKDSHSIELRTKNKTSLILIKALNGYGKTTILTAIQLALYGRFAPVVKDSKKKYSRFIMHLMNRLTDDYTSIELVFSIINEGKRCYYKVSRKWKQKKDSNDITENFIVFKNNIQDKLLTEKWLEFIEGLLPLNILPLFFFDGEKVEAMANLDNSASMLQTSIYSLFGMDIVSKLEDDLRSFNYRITLNESKNINKNLLGQYRNNILNYKEEEQKLHQEKANTSSHIEYYQSKIDELENKFYKIGGELYNRREELNKQILNIKKELELCDVEKNYIMATEGPFLMVKPLLIDIKKQVKNEMEGKEAEIAVRYLDQHSDELKTLLNKELGNQALIKLNGYFSKKKQEYTKNSKIEKYLNLSNSSYAQMIHLISHVLPELEKKLKLFEKRIFQLEKEKENLLNLIHGIPSSTEIQPILDKMNQYKMEIETLKKQEIKIEEQIRSVRFRLNESVRILKNYILNSQLENHEDDKQERIQYYSQIVQKTLLKFKEAVTIHHLTNLEGSIKKCFNKLLHKQNFIKSVAIHPDNFTISLEKNDNDIILPENLSAGERQLLATSIIWALSLESGIEAPIIIDTPLGRLDSLHRKNIVQNYFIEAGKQVILLYTDQEITEDLFNILKNNIAHEYIIEYNEQLFSSKIRKIS